MPFVIVGGRTHLAKHQMLAATAEIGLLRRGNAGNHAEVLWKGKNKG
jgi:hypothetical protein